MLERLKNVISKELGVSRDSISNTLLWKDAEFDSLDYLSLASAAEAEFGIDIPVEELVSFAGLQEMAAWLEVHCTPSK